MFSPEFPRTQQNRTRQALAVLVASGALLLSSCGIFGDTGSDGKSEPTGTTIAVKPNKAPAADGQFKTTMKFYPDGTAVSTVEPGKDSYGEKMSNHYSCPAEGPNLQVTSHDSYGEYGAAGSTQVIENSIICQDGQVTESDFRLHEAMRQPN